MLYRNANLGHYWIALATGYAEILNTYFSKRLRSFQVEKTNPDWYRIAVSEKKLEKVVDNQNEMVYVTTAPYWLLYSILLKSNFLLSAPSRWEESDMDKQSCVSGTEGINPKVLPKSFQRTIIGGATGTGIGILLFFLGILMLLPAPASATATWFGRYVGPWSYSDSYGDHKAIVQTTDGGYATVGAKYYWGFLTKLSATGEVQWSHVVGDDTTYRSTYFSHMAATPDGGVVAAGHTAIGPQLGSDDLLVMKFSSTGTVVWQRVYGAEGLHIRDPLRIYVNDDGTLSVMASFLLGGCNSCGCSEINVYHLKLDGTTGTMLAETMLDSSPHGRKVAGGFVTMVALYNLDISQYTLTLNKFNDSGTNQWSKQYLAVDPDNSTNLIGLGKEDMSITEIPNGYILGGMGYDGEYYIFRIDSTGSVQWMKRFDCYPDDEYGTSLPSSDIVTTTDGAVLISIRNGYSTVENTILKVNTADGSLLWANRYREGGGGQNYFNSLTPLAAGYFAACGYARVAVLDSSGNLAQPCDPLEITPVTAEITCSSVKWEEHSSPGKGYCDLFPALQSAPCDLIHTSAGGFSPTEFCGGDNGGTCDADHFDLCTTKDDCTTAGGYWYDDLCHQSPEETELINNHYIGACGLTDTQSFTLDHDAFVTRINVWYNTRIGGDSLHVVMTEPDSSQKIFDTVKGSCDPYQTWWCEGMISLNQVFAAGTYVLASDSASMCSDPSDKTTLVVYGNKVTNSPPGNAMPLPNGQESPIITAPAAAPVINIDPATANPLGFGPAASGGTTLSLTAGISGLSGPADLYLGISLGTEIYLFDNDNNLHPLSDGMVKWRANTTGGINKRILPDIDMSAFPGTYTFYFFMTPAGHMDNFRLWAIPLVIGGSDNLTKSRTIALGQDVSGPLGDDILTVLSNTGENSISSVGSDSIDFLHDESNHPNPTLLIAYNTAGNPVLLKLSDDPSDDFTVDSTALALVLYDPNILLLPHEDFNRVRTAVEANSRLRSLTADILALIKAKDPNPLDYDTHPELYQEAVAIAQDALGNIFADADGQFSGFQGSSDKTPLEVVDDKDHTTPEVALTNRTMCYYEIKATRDGNPLSQSPYEIERRNLLDYHLTKWPPGLDYEVTSKVGAGDGKLSFQFQKRKKLSVFYCMMSAASTAIGVGSTKLADIEKGAEALASAGGEIVSLMNKALATTPNNKAEADKLAYDLIYGVFHSGYTLVTTVYETQIKNELKHKFFQTAFKIFSSKMIVWATTSYAAGDIAATLWDLHHAPDNYSEEGYQVNGEYPVRLTITNVDPGKGKPGDMITVDFENSIPSAILPVKLMLGEKEVGKIFDGNQRQIIFTVPDGAKTGTLKLSYGIAESNGVVFTVGDPATTIPGSISGKSHTVVISDHSPENDAVKMAVSANWKIDNATTAATVSSSDGFTSLLGYSDVRTTTLLFQLEESNNFLVQTRGNFTITLNNTPIEGVQAMYLDWQGYGWANVTFGKPFYSMDTSQLCSKVSPLKESGITFNIAQNGDVIIGDYYFPGSGEGAVVPVLLNVPYTCYGKNASGNDETWTGVWKTEIDLKFRNYKPFEYSGHCPCD